MAYYQTTAAASYDSSAWDPCDGQMEFLPGGLKFHSSWEFSPGTMLKVGMQKEEGECCGKFVKVEGMVVECKNLGGHSYEITLLLLDGSQELESELSLPDDDIEDCPFLPA